MSWTDVYLLAIALAMDACVVSFSHGLVFTSNRVKNSLTLATFVGFFQFAMPVIGFYFANSVNVYLAPIKTLLVFLIFLVLGLKFIVDAFDENQETIDCISLKCLLAISFATSIDALAAGASMYFTGIRILKPSLIIGLVTFIMSIAGFWGGNSLKKFPTKYLGVLGGLILILLAIKTVL